MNHRFLRKVSRITLDWSVEAQSLVDARYRRSAKALRRLRRHDAELATRLEAAFERARVDDDARLERTLQWFQRFVEAEREAEGDAEGILAELRAEVPGYMEEFIRTVSRGVDRVEALAAPPELAGEHASLVAAQREYVTSLHRLADAYTGDSIAPVTAAVEDAERARAAIDTAMARLWAAASPER